jgi:small subunit ribosomal protein S18
MARMQMRRTRTKEIQAKQKRPHSFIQIKKYCKFCKDNQKDIDYKDIKRLERLINERGKILPPRITGNCAKHQRRVTIAIKRARFLALLPYLR